MNRVYDFAEIEGKWQSLWEKSGLYEPDIKGASKPYYNLWMFPYPSGARMHVGHAYASTGADIHGRYMRMNGFDVFQPMGFDAFGIHGENYALKVGRHPRELMDELCVIYRDSQFKRMGHGYDWSHEVRTYHPNYYRWTQWIFLQLYKNGLAYRKKSMVNWCPSCKTVLADEQVIQGECERCGSIVEKKEMDQWFFKITQYSQKLLDNLSEIDWSEKIKVMQENWIGRSEGVNIDYPLVSGEGKISCFTTRPDTNFGASFLVLAPEHPLVLEITTEECRESVVNYIDLSKQRSDIERLSTDREKTGVFTGAYVLNRLNNRKMPVWVSDFVLMNVGTGAVVGVPAHDLRDFEFAVKFGLPIERVVSSRREDGNTPVQHKSDVFEGEGVVINSDFLNNLSTQEARKKISSFLEEKGWGSRQVHYRLRDWCISRQRYWGAPIPIIYCENCGEKPVLEKDLPVLLPEAEDWRPTGTGKSPLASIDNFVEITCPYCGGKARRETDVCDNFLDSAWYYYAYPSYREVDFEPFEKNVVEKWLPVNMYVGGAEHAVLHLMYTRFITMALNDLGLVPFEEPFPRFFAHGLITKDGCKMSKSKGNVINPDKYIDSFGADVFRTYLMFLGPYDSGGDFSDSGLQGVVRFLDKIWQGVVNSAKGEIPHERLILMNRAIEKVSRDMENFSFNTAVAALMTWVKKLDLSSGFYSDEVKVILKLVSPFAPHMAEELWFNFVSGSRGKWKKEDSIHLQSWPKFDKSLLLKDEVTIIIQKDGRLLETVKMSRGVQEEFVVEKALSLDKVKRVLGAEGKKAERVVFIKGRLINFVTK